VTAVDAAALADWLTGPRREALEVMGRLDGRVAVDRTGVRLVSRTIGGDAGAVERAIQEMVTAVHRFGS
jgi:hypothetical protein